MERTDQPEVVHAGDTWNENMEWKWDQWHESMEFNPSHLWRVISPNGMIDVFKLILWKWITLDFYMTFGKAPTIKHTHLWKQGFETDQILSHFKCIVRITCPRFECICLNFQTKVYTRVLAIWLPAHVGVCVCVCVRPTIKIAEANLHTHLSGTTHTKCECMFTLNCFELYIYLTNKAL